MNDDRTKPPSAGERPATRRDFAIGAAVLVIGTCLGFLGYGTYVDDQLDVERMERGQQSAEGQKRDDRLSDRLVRVERVDPRLCSRSEACRSEVRRERAERRRQQGLEQEPDAPGERRPRRDDDRAPDQRADRPPRAPAQPPSTPSPTPGSGGDDPPPPPQTATPVPPPSAPITPPVTPTVPARPKPIVEVDLPPVDLDGARGLLPRVLPDVNLPKVDVPPVRVPGLPRIGP
jgi:hypothetical protein